MKSKLIITSLIIFSFHFLVFGQQETYSVKKASFSSDQYDEFCPVYYKNGIVFCTNRIIGLTTYSTLQNKGLFKICFTDTIGKVSWQSARLLSKELSTKLNDGPVTFNSTGDTIYFSRNIEVNSSFKDISSKRNKLGLFNAVLVDGKWTKIKELRFNNEWYNVTTPSLSPDGKNLYFSSDKPGGYGGFDIYSSQWKGNYWSDPVNLGPVINTKGNEAYPFINPSGEMFFSSDGHPGLGGEDIFYARQVDSIWLAPVRLDPPVNSKYDDFGIVTDSLIESGYFSSNRDKSVDIYKFKTNFPQIFYATIQKENHYCFRFSDGGAIKIDTLNLRYVWDFGDGRKTYGEKVTHCFTGPGNYNVKLDIIDRPSGKTFFSKLAYNLEIKDIEQPYINTQDIIVKGDSINFDGLKSNLPGYEIMNYSWDFGEGTKLVGVSAKHAFETEGEFLVNLGLTLKSKSTGNINKTGVTKKIIVLNNLQERDTYIAKTSTIINELPDIRNYSYAIVDTVNSAETEFNKDVMFEVELLSSKIKIDVKSNIFRNVPIEYDINETFDKNSGNYSYIIDHQTSLMDTYIAYKEGLNHGFNDSRVKIRVLTDPPEKELNMLVKIFGNLTDTYFDRNNQLASSAYLLFDQIAKLMNKYPEIKLEIAVHTDHTGLPENRLMQSKTYSQIVVNYLVNKGIESKRLKQKGFGGTRPIASNASEKSRILNRRINFTIIRD